MIEVLENIEGHVGGRRVQSNFDLEGTQVEQIATEPRFVAQHAKFAVFLRRLHRGRHPFNRICNSWSISIHHVPELFVRVIELDHDAVRCVALECKDSSFFFVEEGHDLGVEFVSCGRIQTQNTRPFKVFLLLSIESTHLVVRFVSSRGVSLFEGTFELIYYFHLSVFQFGFRLGSQGSH